MWFGCGPIGARLRSRVRQLFGAVFVFGIGFRHMQSAIEAEAKVGWDWYLGELVLSFAAKQRKASPEKRIAFLPEDKERAHKAQGLAIPCHCLRLSALKLYPKESYTYIKYRIKILFWAKS